MKTLNEELKKVGMGFNKNDLFKSFKEAKKDDAFNEMVSKLKVEEEELISRTSVLEECARERHNCLNCQNILECKNKIPGYVYSPMVVNGTLEFNYEACQTKKEIIARSKYLDNIYLFDIPKEIKEAKMKDIYLNDENRFEVIKWLQDFIKNYSKTEEKKGLYLNGSFGCGKTYLIAAAFNELAKKDVKSAIIYWPEFLRDLKSSFDDGFNEKYEYIKKVPLLLIDDIGAENTTAWGRDEILGTILQYRMQEHKTTFFTSNLSIKELELHFSLTKNSLEEVKARRIIERIEQLTEKKEMVGKNLRK